MYLRKLREKADNFSIRVYVNKIENRITFKIKSGLYLKLLTPETKKLLVREEKARKLKIKIVKEI